MVVKRHLVRCQKYIGSRIDFPMSTDQVLAFIGYLFEHRKVSGATAGKYISALRTLHLVEGYAEPALRPSIVQAVLKGQSNYDEELRRLDPSKTRLPVTLGTMH